MLNKFPVSIAGNDDTRTAKIKLTKNINLKLIISLISVIGVTIFVFIEGKINIIDALKGFPEFAKFFAGNFLPPNFGNTPTYIPLILQTIMFALVGTYISAILAFMFGLLLSERTNPIVWLRMTVLFIMSLFRNVPFLVWASLLVYIFGIGNMVGLIALILATLGFLARSYAESISEISDSKMEALKASGASYLQILFHGIIPEFIPSWLNWTLFSFEINMRASAILGMVGAGGIGIMIQTNIRLFKYKEACSLILILVGMVILTELSTGKLRKIIK